MTELTKRRKITHLYLPREQPHTFSAAGNAYERPIANSPPGRRGTFNNLETTMLRTPNTRKNITTNKLRLVK
jgi:hypothetical protein